jgi:hypothetical protein
MRKSVRSLSVAAIVMAVAVPLLAGGFYVTLGNPEANQEARALNAVLTIRPDGCHEPQKATITAKATGLVDGRRESLPMKVIALSAPGMHAITRQWPAEGRWVLEVVATYQGHSTHALVPVGPNGVERNKAKYAAGNPSEKDIAAMLDAALQERASK